MVDIVERKGSVLTPPEPLLSSDIPLAHPARGRFRLGTVVRPLLLAALLGGGVWYVNTHPQETQEARQYVQGLIDQFHASRTPSQGEIFNHRALSGEISPANSLPLPKDESIQLVQQRTQQDQRRYFLLPERSNTLNYEVKRLQFGDMLGIQGELAGATFVSPYDGYLSWATYESNGAMSIRLRKLQPSITEATPGQIEFIVQDARLLLPSELFSTREIGEPGRRTTYSSETPIRAGQLMFELTSDRPVPGSYALTGNYQVVVNGASILPVDNKAVLVAS